MLSTEECRENPLYLVLNNTVHVKLSERSNPVKIFHIIDIEKLFDIDNLDDFISNTSF